MCGIIGVVAKDTRRYESTSISPMLETLSRRGPDDQGEVQFPHCILGQTRLSIIDLSGGHQPMRDNTHPVAITFNGEIYNYRELKKELSQKGHRFSTESDTEVILKAYLEYGANCPNYLEGMFAFAIWDERKEQLFLARDRFGKKPLYYAYDDAGNLIVASEIKALFASGRVKGKINYEAIDNYLHLFYIPPTKTAYQNIFTLPPAHSAVYKNGSLSISRYWTMPINPLEISEEEAKEKLVYLLDEAVRKRMIADVEIGTFLSGGVDSSIITYLAQKHTQKRLKSFSAGFEHYINELPYARKAAKIAGTDHHELQINVNLPEVLAEVCAYYDEPFADSSSVPQYLISKFAHSKVKVVLSGDGGDEVFLGYGWYWKWWNLGRREKLKHPFASRDAYRYHLANIQNFRPLERLALWKNPLHANMPLFITPEDPRLTSMGNINNFDFNVWLPGDILTKVDRSSMMTSLEVRSPFLDTALVEFAFNLPERFKTDRHHGKIILKDMFEGIFGREFMDRRKQGFSAPARDWLRQNDFKEFVYSTLTGPSVEIHSLFRRSFIDSLLNLFYEKSVDRFGYRIWILLCLELWLKSHSKYHV